MARSVPNKPATASKAKAQQTTAETKSKRPHGLSTAQVSAKGGVSDRQIRQLVIEGKFPASHSRGYFDEAAAGWAMADYWREKASGATVQAQDDKARKEKNEADLSELKLKKEMGLLARVKDVALIWADAIQQLIQVVKGKPWMTDAQREEICADFRGIKLREIKD